MTKEKTALVCAMVCTWAAFAHSQQLTVRLLEGKTGKPMTNKNVAVEFGTDGHHVSQVRIGSDGTGRVAIPTGAKTVTLSVGNKDGKEPNRIAYLDCNGTTLLQVPVDEVIRYGLSTGNKCGRADDTPKPGEVIYWGKSIPWWTPDFQ